MAFLLYSKTKKGDKLVYQALNLDYRLAGYNLIYKVWESVGHPINQGWTITRDQLQAAQDPHFNGNLAFLIDFHPGARWRIGIEEIVRIHLFTYGEQSGHAAYWSPIMLELNDVMYQEFDELSPSQKENAISRISVSEAKLTTCVEFLYIHGDDQSWKWGRNGSTNAAFIQQGSREYFRQFF